MEYTKVDSNTIKVTKTEQNTSEINHTYENLISQRADIIRQKEEYVAQRDKEIAEIIEILNKCKELAITEKKEVLTK